MGLDMYLEGRKYFHQTWGGDQKEERLEDGFSVSNVVVRIGYWRKHPDLHGYIVQRFAGGVDDCREIALSAENLIEMIGAVKGKQLPHTTGFFFGASRGDGEEVAKDVKILEAALKWLEASDEDPIVTKKVADLPGATMLEVKPNPRVDGSKQTVTRSVVYQASW